jgi:hypothetical protein
MTNFDETLHRWNLYQMRITKQKFNLLQFTFRASLLKYVNELLSSSFEHLEGF